MSDGGVNIMLTPTQERAGFWTRPALLRVGEGTETQPGYTIYFRNLEIGTWRYPSEVTKVIDLIIDGDSVIEAARKVTEHVV